MYDSEKGSARWGVVNDLLGVMVIDSHRQLQNAWKAAAEDGVTEEEVRQLSGVPITEEECLALGPRWRDPVMRDSLKNAWTGFARDKYGDAGKGTYLFVLDFLTLSFPFGIVAAMVVYLFWMRQVREEEA